jgi:hypothetical protein
METVPQPATLLLLASARFATRAEPQEDGIPETLALATMQRIAAIKIRNFQIAMPSLSKLGRLRMRMIALTMVLIFATGFLGAIPTQANRGRSFAELSDQYSLHALDEQLDGNYSNFTVALHSGIGPSICFDITELNGTVQLGDEQKEAIATCVKNNGTVQVIDANSGSYARINGLIFAGPIPSGIFLELYLDPVAAKNCVMASVALAALCVFIVGVAAAYLVPTVIGPGIAAVIGGIIILEVSLLCYDYDHIYNSDKNEDESFNIVLESAIWREWTFARTPRYLWVITEVGAWIVKSENTWDLPMVCWCGSGAGGKRVM